MNLTDGELITLDDDKEYIVVKRMECNNSNYVYLMTSTKPISILLAKEEVEPDGNISLLPVTDQEEAKYVLDRFTNT